jgi:polyphosphate glucokinase
MAVSTLAIDIGGTGLKVIVLDEHDKAITERARIETPHPATPKALLSAIKQLAAKEGKFDRVSVGFPGVVRRGVVETSPNLHPTWAGFHIEAEIHKLLHKPVRVLNDAAIQGYGAVSGKGVELMITLGTGVGSSLFLDGMLVPNLELGHTPFRKGETYEEQLCNATLKKIGKKRWNKRLEKAMGHWEPLFNPDHLYLGGGNSRLVNLKLPPNVSIVDNKDGLLGGLALWRK